MTRRLLLLFAGTAALWLLVAIPARILGDDDTFRYSGTAALLCVVPMAVTLVITARLAAQKSPMFGFMVLGIGGARLFAVLVAAGLLINAVPYYNQLAFSFWLGVFYMATLMMELSLWLSRQPVR